MVRIWKMHWPVRPSALYWKSPFSPTRCKHNVRWQHLSQMEERSFKPALEIIVQIKTQQTKCGTSAATYRKLMEPYCFYLLSSVDRWLKIKACLYSCRNQVATDRGLSVGPTDLVFARKISDAQFIFGCAGSKVFLISFGIVKACVVCVATYACAGFMRRKWIDANTTLALQLRVWTSCSRITFFLPHHLFVRPLEIGAQLFCYLAY